MTRREPLTRLRGCRARQIAMWVLIPAVAAGGPTITYPAPIAGTASQPGPGSGGEEPIKQLVVMLRGTLGEQSFNGAGIIVGQRPDRLYIATAHHVVRQATQQAERIEAQFRWLPGEWKTVSVLADGDVDLDLAVLAADARGFSIPDLPWGALGDPKALAPGSRAFPVGFPNAMPWFRPQQPHVVNTVTAQQIRTEGQVFPGNSGGALVTEDWRLVGLVSNVTAVLTGSTRIDLIVEKLKEWRYPVALTVATTSPTPPQPEAEPPATAPTAPPAPPARGRGDPEASARGRGDPAASARGRGDPAASARGRGGPETPVIARPGEAAEPVWRIVGTGDFNGDGRSDLLWHNRDTSHIQSWLLNATRIIGRPEVDDERGQRAIVGLPWTIVGTGDFNGDGKVDILWHNGDTSHIQAWFLDGVKIIGRQEVDDERGQRAVVGLPWRIVATGDLNGDRKVDILWHNGDTSHIQAWFLDGVKIIGRQEVDDERGQRAVVGLPWRIVATGDLNGDRKTDILWHNRDTNNTQMWLLDGMKIAGRANVDDENGQRALVGLPWSIVGALDFNGDGRFDILWHNRDTNRVQAWVLSGARIAGRPEIDDK